MKESLNSQDRSVVHRLTFNTFNDIQRNGGVVAGNPTISNGNMTFDGTGDAINYTSKLGIIRSSAGSIEGVATLGNDTANILWSIADTDAQTEIIIQFIAGRILRVYCILATTAQFDLRTTGAVAAVGQKFHFAITQNGTSPVIYINGVAVAQSFTTNTNTTRWTNFSYAIDNYYVGANNYNSGGVANNFIGSCDYINVYNKALSASEVSALYKNSLYKRPAISREVLNINPTQGVIADRYGNAITNTAVTLAKRGMGYAEIYNGTTSNLNLGSGFNVDAGSVTLVCWFRTKASGVIQYLFGKNVAGSVQGRYGLYIAAADTLSGVLQTNTTTHAPGAGGTLVIGKRYCAGIVIDYGASVTAYLDGVAGTPISIAGQTVANPSSAFEFYSGIGNSADGSGTQYPFTGDIGEKIMQRRAWSAEEMARYYNSTKNLYS